MNSDSYIIFLAGGTQPYFLTWLHELRDRFRFAYVISENSNTLIENDLRIRKGLAEVAQLGLCPEDIIIIDRSTELGLMQASRAGFIQEFCSTHSFPSHRLIYTSQNLNFENRDIGVSWVFAHYYMWALIESYRRVESSRFGFDELVGKPANILCMNMKIRPHRVAVANQLLRSEWRERVHLSWVGKEHLFSLSEALSHARKDFKSLIEPLSPEVTDFHHRFDGMAHGLSSVFGVPLAELSKSSILLVTESEYSIHARRFTEKSLKAVACFRPFLVFGSPNILETLRTFGFRTFSSWWNEDYDRILDPEKRMIELFRSLNEATEVIENGNVSGLTEVLSYNQEHLLLRIPDLMRERFLSEMMIVLR